MTDATRSKLHSGLCRTCHGTGMAATASDRVPCAECQGEGCLP